MSRKLQRVCMLVGLEYSFTPSFSSYKIKNGFIEQNLFLSNRKRPASNTHLQTSKKNFIKKIRVENYSVLTL